MSMADRLLAPSLLAARKEAGLSQETLAALLGLSRVQVSRIENGKRATTTDVVDQWLRACGWKLDAISVRSGTDLRSRLIGAVTALDDESAANILRLVEVWPALDGRSRLALLALFESYHASIIG